MPRVFNQKIKILYLMRVFLERTDEEQDRKSVGRERV